MGPDTRFPAVAGRFYPSDVAKLQAEVASYLGTPEPKPALGAIVPHAGYVYSGKTAGAVFRRLRIPERVVILCPNHTGRGASIAVKPTGVFRVPGADVAIDAPLAARILARVPGAREDVRAHEREHAIEVELPFLVALRPDVRIVPIVVGGISGAEAVALGEGLAEAIGEDDVLVLASSDMSHYLPQDVAVEKDRMAIDRLLAVDPVGLFATCERHAISMCGVLPATALLRYARARSIGKAELVAYATSGEAFGAFDSVVGYAGVVL